MAPEIITILVLARAEVGGSDSQLSKVQSAISLSSTFGSELSLESMDSDQGPTKKVTHYVGSEAPIRPSGAVVRQWDKACSCQGSRQELWLSRRTVFCV